MKPTFLPFRDQVVVKRLPQPSRSHLLELPPTGDLICLVQVMRIGPEVREVRPGDTVVANTALGQGLDTNLMVLPERAILAWWQD